MARLIGVTVAILSLTVGLAGSVSAEDAGSCKKCLSEKIAGTSEEVAVAAAFGAIGGLGGGLPGALCGAVIAASGAAVIKLVQVAQCEPICAKEAASRKDPEANKCEDLMTKTKAKK